MDIEELLEEQGPRVFTVIARKDVGKKGLS
jgi:hypothetical protein